jgi:SAM-dependent methyltransferase
MNYVESNKEAWEEAFEHRSEEWCEDISLRLQNEPYPFLEKDLIEELHEFDFTDKTIGQFCCNNGRELLTIMKFGAKQGIGFDIAENMIAWANDTAQKTRSNCSFVATNILNIDEKYYNSFDFIFVTIGALTWFHDLNLFFEKVSCCLKTGGTLIINEMHPVTSMLAIAGEENYDEGNPNKLVNSYFKQEPWEENNGMGYMCENQYESKTFYSYSHTLSAIVNALSSNRIVLSKLREFQYDISGSFGNLDNLGIPLSYILIAKRSG